MSERSCPDAAQGDAWELESEAGFVAEAHRILAELVGAGAALGWVEAPSGGEVAELLERVVEAVRAGDGALRAAYVDGRLAGVGYWSRYARAGRWAAPTLALVADARAAGIEVLTLDARGDNTAALGLYSSLGFSEYGRLPDFVAVGDRRYDTVFRMLDLRAS